MKKVHALLTPEQFEQLKALFPQQEKFHCGFSEVPEEGGDAAAFYSTTRIGDEEAK